MAADTGMKKIIATAIKAGGELMKDPRFVESMTDPKVLAESNAAMKAAMAGPEARKFGAKFAVDAMEQVVGDIAKLGKDMPKHGIPTTREEFDKAYANAASLTGGDMLKASVGASAELASNPALQKHAADLGVTSIKTAIPDVISELKDRGTDPNGYIKEVSKMTLEPAGIDLSKLDPRLTADERKLVEASKSMSEEMTRDGRLQSNPEDAPASSKWANRIKAEQAAAQGRANGVG